MMSSLIEKWIRTQLGVDTRDGYASLKTRIQGLGINPTGLSADSRMIEKGDLFFAYPGHDNDGRKFIKEAVMKGCEGVIWESDIPRFDKEIPIPNFGFPSVRSLVGCYANDFFGEPSQDLQVFAVTGTNGKTTCVSWLAEALSLLGVSSASIGTLGIRVADVDSAPLHSLNEWTTPDPISLQRALSDLVKLRIRAVALEASSHALDQDRLNGTRIQVAIFTNLSRDHLDYHGDFETYGRAKLKLFARHEIQQAVINADDDFGVKLGKALRNMGRSVLSYGIHSNESDLRIQNFAQSLHGTKIDLVTPWGDARLHVQFFGEFNLKNLLAVMGALLSCGYDFPSVCNVVEKLRSPEGRLQRVGENDKRYVFVDYAHTPEALAEVLTALKALKNAKSKLITIFGAGGDRDKGKRTEMGSIVAHASDKTIVTSDNPRFESLSQIIKDLVESDPKKFIVEEDRHAAIELGLKSMSEGDILLIAGKGHEKYQLIGEKKIPFDDVQIVDDLLKTIPCPLQNLGPSGHV